MRHEPSSLSSQIALYLDALHRRGLSASTQKLWGQAVRAFVFFVEQRGHRRAGDLHPTDVQEFQLHLVRRRARHGRRAGQPLATGTVVATMSGVRGFTRWLTRRGDCLLDPSLDLPVIRTSRALPRVLTAQETQSLLESPASSTPHDLRDRAILELLYASALRVGELVGLDLVDLNLAAGEVLVRQGKGGTSRRVPMGGCAVRALIAYLDKGRPAFVAPGADHPTPAAVFLNQRGLRFERPGVRAMVRTRAARGGWGRITPHTLRHTAAVDTLRGGADIRHIQELLGHADVKTTAIYTQLDLQSLKETLERSHPRGRWFRARRSHQ
jgi:site-specific recombinase XerD